MRLDKFLSSGMGLGSRTDVKKFIKNGRVEVIGTDTPRPELNIDPEKSEVYFDGKLQKYKKFVYLMLNKPKGYVSATVDRDNPTVTELVPENFLRFELFPVGRLDIDTEGLCILTNDGELSHRLLSPKNHISKKYCAKLDAVPKEEDLEKIRNGITLEDGYKCKPATVLFDTDNETFYITIYEGKYHQIKRMFGAVGRKVIELIRVEMNKLSLDNKLAPGEIRELTDEELKLLQV